ncbi:MAG: hypothetical protein R3219_05995 [Hydrogenovibrio sp.]|nr:hypothetical protein [Hydrogenovibrio sp.]
MDIIVTDHDPANLERIYTNTFLYQTELYSVMCEPTDIPWLQFIPNRDISEPGYIDRLYGEIYRIAEHLKQKGLAEHYNVAKIGNKFPYYHIHLVFRKPQDEAWPDAIWCRDDLSENPHSADKLKHLLADYF